MELIPLMPYAYAANCYLLTDAGHALVVDPAIEADMILERLKKENCVLDGILLTHGHFDHILTVDELRDAAGATLYIHEADAPMLSDGDKNAYRTFFGRDLVCRPAEVLLTDGQILTVGNGTLRVIHTPGHSPGSVCFLNEADGWMVTGDTLFAQSCGRCDLWGGSVVKMRESLKHLRHFDGNLKIYPGHGHSAKLSVALDNVYYL